MGDWAHEAWATAAAVIGIAIAATVWHWVDKDNLTDEIIQLREARVRVVETCGNEPDTDLEECVDRMMALVESGPGD